MNDKKLYQQKNQAKLDEWQAKINILKAKTSKESADTQLKMNKEINALETKIEEGKMKLSQLSEASDDAWDSLKDGVESAWDSLKNAFNDAESKEK